MTKVSLRTGWFTVKDLGNLMAELDHNIHTYVFHLCIITLK